MKLGKIYPLDAMKLDPFSILPSYKGKVCILHGTKDGIVDVSYAKRAYETYQKELGEENVELHLIEGGNHGFSKKNHDKEAISYLEKFAFLSD